MPKRKYKKKMKGGNLPETNLNDPLLSKNLANTGDAGLMETKTKRGAAKSTYKKYNTGLFINIVVSFSIIGIIWFFISRSLVRHKYSEAVCYGLIGFSVLLSLILVIIAGIKSVSKMSENGMLDALKKIIKVTKYLMFNSFPAQLILIQLGVLFWLSIKHAEYLFTSDTLPQIFTTFNITAIIMIFGQLFAWRSELRRLLVNKLDKRSRLLIPGFVLAFIISGLSIGQIYVILEHLRTDC